MRRPGLLLAAVLVFGLTWAGPALAHRPQLRINMIRLDRTAPNGYLVMRPTNGGSVSLQLPEHPAGASLVLDLRLNGATLPSKSYAIDGDAVTWPLGFATKDQDKIELHDARVVDASGNVIAGLGAAKTPQSGYVMAAPLVWVVDTWSDVGFTRGGDTVLKKNGAWNVGFDALRSRTTGTRLNNSGNYAEIEVSINDGPWQVFSVTFDVLSGKSRPAGRPGRNIGTTPNDRVRIRRVDVFDASGNKFAMLGIRMGKQGHYAESPPPLPPSPTPGPPTPSPAATPVATATPDATPEATATPDTTPEPTPEPTPDPSPDPTP